MVTVDPIDIRSVYPVRMSTRDRTDMVSRMVNNLRTVERSVSPADMATGVGWYRVARRVIGSMAAVHGVTVNTMAGVVAAASPRMSWYDNLRMADMVHRDRSTVVQLIPAARRPVVDILDGAAPLSTIRGRKTRSFYLNLIGDMHAVTGDIWMLRMAIGHPSAGDHEYRFMERSGGYDMVSTAVTVAAADSPWPVAAAEYQSALWHPYRIRHARRTDDRIDMTDTTTAMAAVRGWTEDTTTT